MARILVVEDEKDISDLICYNLEREGFEVSAAASGQRALELMGQFRPDLVVLDLMLEGMQGLDALRHMRSSGDSKDIPVIIVSAKSSETDRITGLETGADDYLPKPFSIKELLSRIRAVLRRAAPQKPERNVLRMAGLAIDFDSVSVSINGEPVRLTPHEFRLLAFLASHPGRAYSREELISKVWKDEAFIQPRTIDVHIRRIRTLLETDPGKPRMIVTVRGFGYMFNEVKPGK